MSAFTTEELQRYSRQYMMDEIGMAGQVKIKQAKVLVVGAGGLGCPALQYLAAAGVGTIGIVDFDKVERNNLHRQILYTPADIGRYKAEAAAEKMIAANPNIHCRVFCEKLREENAATLIGEFDLVIDGSDNFTTRYLVNDICVKLDKPLVYGSILNFEGQLAVFNYLGSKNLRHIYPEPPAAEDVPNCHENGVLGVVPGIIGVMLSEQALKIILELPFKPNNLIIIDFKNYQFTHLNY